MGEGQHPKAKTWRCRNARRNSGFRRFGRLRSGRIEPDLLAHVALFAALKDLVVTYGEAAVADFARACRARVTAGEFSLRSRF